VKSRLHSLCAGAGAHEQDHDEMTAQQRHRRVLEVAVQTGEGRGHVRDDAGPVVPEHGHGDDLVSHGVDVIATQRRARTSSNMVSVSLPVKVFCWLT
jgi:hypothetical protein